MKLQVMIGAALLVLLSGCSKLTMDNYNKIKVGMPYDRIVQLIGKPDKCDDVMGLRSCTWSNQSSSVHISFAGDKVLIFSSENLK